MAVELIQTGKKCVASTSRWRNSKLGSPQNERTAQKHREAQLSAAADED